MELGRNVYQMKTSALLVTARDVCTQKYLCCELKSCSQRLNFKCKEKQMREEGQIILPDKYLNSILMGYLQSWEDVVLLHTLCCKGKESRVSFFPL